MVQELQWSQTADVMKNYKDGWHCFIHSCWLKDNPVDSAINEYYLWHGCKPEAAEGITDANFDLKRDLTLSGHVFRLNEFAT